MSQNIVWSFYWLLATLALFCSRLLQVLTKWIIKIKLDHANFLENFDRISEFSSKWILISGILSENTKSNYTERYDSLLKMKNHVSIEGFGRNASMHILLFGLILISKTNFHINFEKF